LAEVNVTIPESRNDSFPGAINDTSIFGNLDCSALADFGDNATSRQNDGI
jgi:hypothetical protein